MVAITATVSAFLSCAARVEPGCAPTTSTSASAWEHVQAAPPDPIMNITEQWKADPADQKLNLGVGAYRNEKGQPHVLSAVRKATQRLASDPAFNKEYLPAGGSAEFCRLSRKLAFGADCRAAQEERIATVQTLSGTGALRVGADFVAANHPGPRVVYLSEPTWGIHPGIFAAAGFQVAWYRYYAPATRQLDFAGLLHDLMEAEEGSLVVLQMCAHNPTGVDPTLEQWCGILEVVRQRRLLPFFDSAYQGFASGDVDADAAPLRMFAAAGVELLVAQSYAKNMGLYGERVGSLSVLCGSAGVAGAVGSQLRAIIRCIYSSPPLHGAALAATIMGSPELRAEWREELAAMAGRICRLRQALYDALQAAGVPGSWEHVLAARGMFVFSGLSRAQCEHLARAWHVYLTLDGRISVAGMSEVAAPYLARAIGDAVARA